MNFWCFLSETSFEKKIIKIQTLKLFKVTALSVLRHIKYLLIMAEIEISLNLNISLKNLLHKTGHLIAMVWLKLDAYMKYSKLDVWLPFLLTTPCGHIRLHEKLHMWYGKRKLISVFDPWLRNWLFYWDICYISSITWLARNQFSEKFSKIITNIESSDITIVT